MRRFVILLANSKRRRRDEIIARGGARSAEPLVGHPDHTSPERVREQNIDSWRLIELFHPVGAGPSFGTPTRGSALRAPPLAILLSRLRRLEFARSITCRRTPNALLSDKILGSAHQPLTLTTPIDLLRLSDSLQIKPERTNRYNDRSNQPKPVPYRPD